MYKEENTTKFFEGELSAKDTLQTGFENSEEKVFLENYQAAIDQSNAEAIPDFDPFSKIQRTAQAKVQRLVKMALPYAAVIFVFFCAYWFFPKNEHSRSEMKLSKQELAEINQHTIQALSLLSSELNNSLKEIENTKELGEPFKRMIRSKIN